MSDPLEAVHQEIARLRIDLDRLLKLLDRDPGAVHGPVDCSEVRVHSPDGSTPVIIRAGDDRSGLYFQDKNGVCRALIELTGKGSRLQLLNESGKPIVSARNVEGHGQVCVAAPDGLARAAIRSTKHGGVVKVISASGRPLGFLFGSDKGGVLELNNQSHRTGASLYAEDDGGMLRLHQGGGEVMASISAHNDSGMLTVFGTFGEQAVTLCASEEGGHVLICDPEGCIRSELT